MSSNVDLNVPSKTALTGMIETALGYRLSLLLVVCIALGGTSQDYPLVKLPAYLFSLLVIGQVLSSQRRAPLRSLLRFPLIIGGLYFLWHVAFLMPLPASVWQGLPGRAPLMDAFEAVGITPERFTLSLTPEKTLFSLFDFLPVIAIALTGVLAADREEYKKAIATVIIMAFISALLGLYQITLDNGYLYSITNRGAPVGLFSNANHQSCFMAMALCLALSQGLRRRDSKTGSWSDPHPKNILGFIACIALMMTIILSGSLAGYALMAIVLPLTFIAVKMADRSTKFMIATILGVMSAALLVFLFTGSSWAELSNNFTAKSAMSRSIMSAETWEASRRFGWLGTGPGSFYDVYLSQENRETMTYFFANHTHNDYVESLLEVGVIGIVLIAAMVLYIGVTVLQIIIGKSQLTRRSSICMVVVLLPIIHSVVDYPLRTIAIASVFTLCLCYPLRSGSG